VKGTGHQALRHASLRGLSVGDAIDGGGGYTYFSPANGFEFSAVLGLTYNFENPHKNYQNGIDGHLDWGASYFLSKQFHFGVVGYYFQQLTGDSGSCAKLGPFKSRVVGVGPQIGYIFPVSDHAACGRRSQEGGARHFGRTRFYG
jgi:hypothetical protein